MVCMIVTYREAGAEAPTTWEFDPEEIPMAAADMIERRFDSERPSFERWLSAVQGGSARARRVLLWYLLQRDHPKLRFEDVNPPRGTVGVVYTKAEVAVMIDQVEGRKRQDPAEKDEILNALYEDLDKAPEGMGKAQ
jgi:hypothetical protein